MRPSFRLSDLILYRTRIAPNNTMAARIVLRYETKLAIFLPDA